MAVEVWAPGDAAACVDAVRQALAANRPMELVGRGSRRGFGRPVPADLQLDLSGLSGVVEYDPAELVLTVKPGTPLAELEALLADSRQQLAFEPPDFGPLWGGAPAAGSVGGAILTGRGGPRRISAGGPRDHCLGAHGVNGFGDAFASGGRVIKNVTGYDLPKLISGSFGTLGVITELSLKVLPAPEETTTLALSGLEPEAAVQAMAAALGSSAQVSGAAYLPAELTAETSIPTLSGASATLLRLEGVIPSVRARLTQLETLMPVAAAERLDAQASASLWKAIADAAFFVGDDTDVWKVSAPPSTGARVLQALLALAPGSRGYLDAGGGAVWFSTPPTADARAAAVRAALARGVGVDGHATLVRAPDAVRAAVSVFHPQAAGVAALSDRVRLQFDPHRLFNPGRMGEA